MRENQSGASPSFSMGFGKIFLLSFFLFSLGTVCVEIVRIDVRFAIFVQDLTRYSLSVFPTINGVPYPDYPVTMTLFAWLFSAAGRFLNQWTLSLFSMLCGSLTVALVWLTGEKMKKGVGVIAASLLFMTLEFNTTIMGFGIDVPVMAAGSLILYLLTAGSRMRRGGSEILFFLLLVFCFLIRGPMGLLLLGSAVGGWLLFARQWKRVVIWGLLGAATVVICMGGGYSLIQAAGGRDLFDQFLAWQITSRMAADDLFFYLFDGPVVFSPSTALAIATLLTAAAIRKMRRGGSVLLPLFGFLLFPLILLSVPGCKHLRYMMITVPAFALIGAWGVRMSFLLPRCRRILRTVFRFLASYGWIIALCAALAVTIVSAFFYDTRMFFRCALLLLFPAAGLLHRKKKGFLRDIFRTGVVLGILGTVFIFPASTCREVSEKFVRTIEPHRTGRLYFYRIGVDHEDLKYLRFLSPEDRADVLYLCSARSPDDKYSRMYRQIGFEGLAAMRPGDILVAKSRDAEQLKKDAAVYGRKAVFLAQGKLGHRKYSAFQVVPTDGAD